MTAITFDQFIADSKTKSCYKYFYKNEIDLADDDDYGILKRSFLVDALNYGIKDKLQLIKFESFTSGIDPRFPIDLSKRLKAITTDKTPLKLRNDIKSPTCEDLQSLCPVVSGVCKECPNNPMKWHYPRESKWYVNTETNDWWVEANFNGYWEKFTRSAMFNPKQHLEFVFSHTGKMLSIKKEEWMENYVPAIMDNAKKTVIEGVNDEKISCANIIRKLQKKEPEHDKDYLLHESNYHMSTYYNKNTGHVWCLASTIHRECKKLDLNPNIFKVYCMENSYLAHDGSKPSKHKGRPFRYWSFFHDVLWGEGWEEVGRTIKSDIDLDGDTEVLDSETFLTEEHLSPLAQVKRVENGLKTASTFHPSGVGMTDLMSHVDGMNSQQVNKVLVEYLDGNFAYQVEDKWRLL